MKHNKIFIIMILLFNILIPRTFEKGDIPIQENGRVKPLDSFARNHLLAMHGKRSLKASALPKNLDIDKLSAIDWFFDIALHPHEADDYRVFNIKNPEIVGSLGLKWDTKHLYNRMEVLTGLQNQLEYIGKIQSMKDEEITPFDEGMLNLYKNVIHFQELCFSLSCLLPLISIEDVNIASYLDIQLGDKISYYAIMQKAEELNPHIENMVNKSEKEWTNADKELRKILAQLSDINQDNFSQILKIIPPEKVNSEKNWVSPWELMDGRKISNSQQDLLNVLSDYVNAYLDGNDEMVNNALIRYENLLTSYESLFSVKQLKNESWYNDVNLFLKSTIFYILAFFLLSISWMTRPVLLRKISFTCLFIGLMFHFYGICLRIIIMQRPPVSTLYESIIFVSLIGVICATLLEYNRKDGIGIFAGSICGFALHFIGFGYANDGDTLGMLVAVLNSNFWLATHVTTITTGYGTSLFAGLLGHVYLFQVIKNPTNTKFLKTINSNMFGATIFALFFTLFGTILGGIWADQSWGRFWGWDPKENGALLIVMWHLMVLHLRISGMAKPLMFCFFASLVNIIVVLAWFGVNLLNVGLHSYGFTDNVAMNLFLFIIIELLFTSSMFYLISNKR
mgnify:CR=1 FL=1